jgi:uncharacterized protein (TIGR02722 family)
MSAFLVSRWMQNAVSALAAAVLVSAVGCSDQSSVAKIDPNDPNQSLVSKDVDAQDWNNASAALVQSMLDSGCLNNAPRKPAIMAISRIRNNSDQIVDTDLLVKNIRITLLQSGKVQVTTTLGPDGRTEDPTATDLQHLHEFNGDAPAAGANPDYTLSGKIISEYTQVGNQSQHVYTFQLSLTDSRTGTAVWEEQRQVGKRVSRPAVAF